MAAPSTVDDYVAALPDKLRKVAGPVVELLRSRMPAGYEEAVNHGMPTWQVPLSTQPTTYNGEPLGYVSLAARASGCSLYLVGVYVDAGQERRLREGFAAAGKRIDLGKSCLRFKRVEDLDLDTLGDVVAGTSPAEFVARHGQARARH